MLKAVILDDEVRGSNLLTRKLEVFGDDLQIEAIFNDPFKALSKIVELNPDVLFLDVEMPGLNGFQFLEKLGSFNFQVIFTTAYDTFTLEALRLGAVDYLVKPIDEDELHTAIFRLKKRVADYTKHIPLTDQNSAPNRLALSTAEGVYFVNKASIMRVEAMSNYSTFYLQDRKKIIVSKTLKEYESVLQGGSFLRINRSVIVNLDHVVKYRKGDGGTLEMNDGAEIEVSASRKDLLMEKLF
ncbi:two-component system LytT family response regulator [Pedobacter sp. AK017]|uniref:LytR/AlgR family response regulator transcription factor n=1 Tax=Pedobacter sp. AK017 TaxID=2723073 RepID=UPI00160C3C86|nr:LytTR family DNA-binding domain-containing protein [Pedobacter sp. AK017]MBB5440295.1 two-component system LytT family response regulator [Pedobacter sp. AK017]